MVSDTALPQDRPLAPGEVDRLVAGFMDRGEPIYRLDTRLIQEIQPDLILAQDLCRVCAVPSGLHAPASWRNSLWKAHS